MVDGRQNTARDTRPIRVAEAPEGRMLSFCHRHHTTSIPRIALKVSTDPGHDELTAFYTRFKQVCVRSNCGSQYHAYTLFLVHCMPVLLLCGAGLPRPRLLSHT